MAFVIKENGTITTWPPPANGTDYQLEEIKPAIGGGFIKILVLGDGITMVIDEDGEGKFHINPVASLMVAQSKRGLIDGDFIVGRGLIDGDFIVGDVLICEDDQIR